MKKQINASEYVDYTFPRLTVLVCVKDEKGMDNLMTASWHSPISRSPPLYGVSIDPSRYTHDVIKTANNFTINFMTFNRVRELHFCGTNSGRDMNKFDEMTLMPQPSKRVESPIVNESYAALECKLDKIIAIGDHSWIVGSILNVQINEKAFGRVIRQGIQPIFYIGKNIYTNHKGNRKNF